MNQLLKEHGYLDGEPGAYGLTEKGKRFGQEHYHDNGCGGWAHRSWDVRTWNEDLPAALRADMAATSRLDLAAEQPIESDDSDDSLYDTSVDFDDDDDDDDDDSGGVDLGLRELAVIGAALVAAGLAVRYGPRLWKKVKRAAKPMADEPEEQGSAEGAG